MNEHFYREQERMADMPNPLTDGDWERAISRIKGGKSNAAAKLTAGHFIRSVSNRIKADPSTFPPNNRPADGRVCNCEDAPCCGCYEI